MEQFSCRFLHRPVLVTEFLHWEREMMGGGTHGLSMSASLEEYLTLQKRAKPCRYLVEHRPVEIRNSAQGSSGVFDGSQLSTYW